MKTPEGGFQGPSTGDLNREAAAVFQAVYGKSKYPADSETTVVFKGGLVSRATGKDLPDDNTGIFTLTASDAHEIDWSDDSIDGVIDWTIYRDFASPALKQDDPIPCAHRSCPP